MEELGMWVKQTQQIEHALGATMDTPWQGWSEHLAQLRHETTAPALHWIDGHVLGNGDVGAVVWGSAERVSVGLSKHDVYELSSSMPHGTRWQSSYSEIRERVMAGERAFLAEIGNHGAPSPGQQMQLSLGALSLELLRGQPTTGITRRLSFHDATCSVQVDPTPFGWTWGMDYAPVTMECLVHAESNVVLVRLDSRLSQHITWSYARPTPGTLVEPTYSEYETDLGVMTHELPEEQDYAVAVHVAAPESMLIATPLGLSGTVTFGGAQGPATLIMTIASGRDAGEDTAAACAVALVDDARTLGADALRAAHRAWWQSFWAQSAVYYDDPALNQAWVMGLYALASSTRPHTSPPNLQGLWNQYDIPPWHTDYHFNVNMQESLWAACSANHPELQESFVRCLATDWRDEFRRFAEEQFAAPGLAIPFCTDWRGRAIGGWPLGVELCPTAWAAQHLWWQWRFTGDLALLRDTVYPFLEESCAFYRHLLVRGADGDYHIELSHSPEQVCPREGGGSQLIFGRDPAIDIALVRELFTNAATASDALGLDASVAEEYRAVAQALPPLPTHQGVLVDYATAFFPWGDAPGMFPWSHRHPSRLVPIFPCEEIGLHSPAEQLQLGRDSFHEFRSYGTMDSTGWSLVFQACIAARLGLAVEAEEALRVTCERFLLGGLLSSHNDLQGAHGPLFQIEALLGFPAAMNEMLLQAVGGVLRVFPALPAGRRAAFTQLRAPGGVLVSAAHDGTGVTALQLRCEQAQVIQLLNPYPGEMVMLRGDDGVEVVTPTPIITWSAQPGVNYHIMPAGSC